MNEILMDFVSKGTRICEYAVDLVLVILGMAGAYRVLLIDDDEIYHYLVRRACAPMDEVGEVLGAKNGEDAIQMLKGWLSAGVPLPDLVFVDINMPVMNGFQFLGAFKALANAGNEPLEQCRLVMLTSSKDERDRERAMAFNMLSDYLVKPEDVGEFRENLRQII